MSERFIRDRYYRRHESSPRHEMRDRHYRKFVDDDYSKSGEGRNNYNRDYRNRDYRYMNDDDYRYDYSSSYDDERAKTEFEEDRKRWLSQLKRKDKFNVPKSEVLNKARNMGIQFNGYDEEDFYMTYLLMLNTFKSLSSDVNTYIKMTKDWLEDENMEGSYKIDLYLDTFLYE